MEWEASKAEKQVDAALAELAEGDAKSRARKALKAGNAAEARGILQAACRDEEGDAPCPRLIVNDSTVEKLGELLNENPNGLLLERDEISGFFAKLEGEEGQSDRAFYLEAFNGDGCFTYDRIGRGTIQIKHCTLSIIGGIQPSLMAPIVRGALNGSRDDGLIQRFQMAVWPDDHREWAWIDREVDGEARREFDAVFSRLANLNLGSVEAPAELRFSPAAQTLFRQWMEEIQAEARGGSLSSALESHLLKMPKTVASLALIFALVQGECSEVGEEAAAVALGWADYLRSHAVRIYAAGEVQAEEGAKLILARRQHLPKEFTARDVHQKRWAGLSERDAVAASLGVLVTAGYVREAESPPSARGGRPSTSFVWNPLIGEREG